MEENKKEQNNLESTTQESSSTNGMFCPACGSRISEGSSFCSHCGAKLTTDNNGGLKVINETKKHGSGIVAWIIAVIAIVALLCTIAFSTVANRDKNSDSLNSVEANATTSETTTDSEETTATPITTTTSEEVTQATTTTATTTEASTEATTTETEKTIYDYVNVLEEYTLENDYGWYTYHFMVIENISDSAIKISTSTIAYSSDDKMLTLANTSCECLGPGCVSVLVEVLNTEEDISYSQTELTISKSIYKSVTENLSYVQNDISNGAIFQVTNNGSYTAEFVQGFALFFSDGELVDYAWTYFTDDDSEIKPDATITRQLTSYKDFDTIELYLDGRHWGN